LLAGLPCLTFLPLNLSFLFGYLPPPFVSCFFRYFFQLQLCFLHFNNGILSLSFLSRSLHFPMKPRHSSFRHFLHVHFFFFFFLSLCPFDRSFLLTALGACPPCRPMFMFRVSSLTVILSSAPQFSSNRFLPPFNFFDHPFSSSHLPPCLSPHVLFLPPMDGLTSSILWHFYNLFFSFSLAPPRTSLPFFMTNIFACIWQRWFFLPPVATFVIFFYIWSV